MGREIKADYSKIYLLPPSLEDWVPQDHPARFIRDFVETLDMKSLGFKMPEGLDGRPAYSAEMMLKIWLYGYMNRIRSSRKLEGSCLESMSLIWLSGSHYPDHNTLWRFWSANRGALRGVFRQVLYVALKADLVGLVLHAVDGTKIGADVSMGKVRRRGELERMLGALEGSIDEVMGQTEVLECSESGEMRLPVEIQDSQRRREKIKEALAELDRVDRDYLHPHDSEARLMRSGDNLSLAYNAQVAVDGGSGLIVAEGVVNEESDNGQLVPMMAEVASNLGAVAEETVADAGYYSPGQLADAEDKDFSALVPLPEWVDRRWSKGEFQKSNFVYDPARDVYVCPLGHDLTYEKTARKSHGRYNIRLYRCRHYKECSRRSECSRQRRGRRIERGEYEAAVERQREKQKDPFKRELLRKRKSIVEHIFAQIKAHQGLRRFSLRGLENVRTQWSMICTVLNLCKLYKYWASGTILLAAR